MLLWLMQDAAERYRENCALIGPPPSEKFLSVLTTQGRVCALSNEGLTDDAIVRASSAV